MRMRQAVLLVDRDGTLVAEPPDRQIDRLDKIRLVPGVIPALRELCAGGYRLVMVSNQDGLGSERYPQAAFEQVQGFLLELFASQGVEFEEMLICPHEAAERCGCRKPRTGLVQELLRRRLLDYERSAVVGDRASDLEFARNLGLRGFRLGDGLGWPDIVRSLLRGARRAELERRTRETEVRVRVDLQSADPVSIRTGIGFFDHMLEQIARHGGFALELDCRGDLHIDEHHTVEDCALALGEALRRALGERRGIARYGFVLPMDESLVQVAIDLGGRPYLVFDGQFHRERVGELPTELVPHFFRSLAESLGAAIHVAVQGENSHHMVEATFKGVGRALRQAVRQEGGEVPSSKGVIG